MQFLYLTGKWIPKETKFQRKRERVKEKESFFAGALIAFQQW
jgi:hypothetical protein